MANIGSEIHRTISWRRSYPENVEQAFERALELIDVTVTDPKNKHRLREILRTREQLVAWYFAKDIVSKEDEYWQNYFDTYNYRSRLEMGRI